MKKQFSYAQLYLRLALGIDFLVPGLDRLGAWGPHGNPNVSWGDWQHFSNYAHQVMGFLPAGLAEALAILATIAEIAFGILLILGWLTRPVATGSGVLLLCFALSMMVSLGVTAPLNYSVFAASAGSFLLATIPAYKWSIDNWLLNKNKNN